MFIFVLLAAVLIYGGIVYYIGWRGYRWLRPSSSTRRFKILYTIVVVFAATSFILGRMSGITILNMIGAYWMALFYLLLLLVPLAHVTVILLRLTRLPRHGTQKWAGALTLILILSLMAHGTYNAFSPVVRTYDIKMDKGASSLDTLNIVMAADTHFGLLSGKGHAERLVKEVNALNPDLILLPGDLFDDDIQPFLDQNIGETLSGLRAPYGIYATLGNHDKHDGTMQELIEALEQSGITVLYDEALSIQGELTLVGRKDRIDPDRLPLNALMDGVDPDKPVILLDHQPYDLDIAEQEGIDLMVSGHTHRGQLFPGSLITDAIYENDWGYLQKGQMHSVVTSGFGFWGPPIRIGTRSEIAHIQIQFE
ncbi:metallophosphoesterase [Paenibacillus sambharensis]|uniref:Metallophosphoesterase n=1 Tax=Paenibacillus sambharensis TaxID=1803190 RepID=A0A2W1LPK5_9BACL|nr:metallophosphoesterase [Paenibacillus sambharensis]PZD96785.1 metallophosphoesterase [Paenibacillus sambharensis]